LAYRAPHDDDKVEVVTADFKVSLRYGSIVYILIENDAVTFHAVHPHSQELTSYKSTSTRFASYFFLLDHGFVRISRSCVINLKYYYSRCKSNFITFTIKVTAKLHLGRTYVKEFKEKLHAMQASIGLSQP
jgi:DNA-binding LytR/AlgR family response regulator